MSRMILWDNDGVLVDTEPWFYRATADVLAQCGVHLTQAAFQDLSLTRGRSVFDLLGDAVGAATRIRLRDQRNQLFTDYLRRDDLVISGVPEVLERLAAHHRMAVVTSSRREHFDVVHAATGLRRYFEFVLTIEDYARSKPHPDPYLAALSRAGVLAESAVVIEDSPRGVQAAVEAGIACLAIPRGLSRGGDFTGAHAILQGIGQVPIAIENLEEACRTYGGPG